MAGAFADSVLGATLQAVHCSQGRQKQTEKRFDRDGTPDQQPPG
jgi:hypothetical protein